MAFVYTSLLCNSAISVGLLTERWFHDEPQPEIKAGRMLGIMWFTSALLSILFGLVVDRTGHRALIVIITRIFKSVGNALLLVAGQLTVWYYNPVTGNMILGICFALAFVTVWTSILYVANPNHLGKSMACVTSVD